MLAGATGTFALRAGVRILPPMSLPDASFTPPPVRQLLLTRTTNRPNRPFAGGRAAFLTIHQTGNRRRGANAHAHARWLARAAPYSWHATIDDREAWQSLDWSEQGWHAGDGREGPGNTGSIGLEICMHEGIDAARADANAAWLAARLRAAGHGRSGIVQHHRWTGKNCPELIRAEPGRWERFLEAVARFEAREAPTGVDARLDGLERRLAAVESALAGGALERGRATR